MAFKEYHNIKELLKDMPNWGAVEGERHSIPDIYGRAIQFYLAMEKAYDEKEITEEVRIWRSLISLIALKHYRQYPIVWEHVRLDDNNSILKKSLRYVPHISIFQSPNMEWDGSNFYVLKWVQNPGEAGKDIFLYSPSTLIYPVADICEVLNGIEGIEWFDYKNKKILQIETILPEPQKKVVFFWLNKLSRSLYNREQLCENKPNAVIQYHLQTFMDDLGIELNSREEYFNEEEINDNLFNQIGDAAWLNKTIGIEIAETGRIFKYTELFSDQLLYFDGGENNLNPFGECEYAEAYRIIGRNNWYAFLPIRDTNRELCIQEPIARCIRMEYIDTSGDEFIHVYAALSNIHPLWPDYDRKYRLCGDSGNTLLKNIAIKYTGQNFPFIAVWPGNICNTWKKYYLIFDEDDANGRISIANEAVEYGENPYVKLVSYVPEVIPLIRKKNRESEAFSIGIVTPRKQDDAPENRAVVQASVGIDFGTSSTKVYAKVEGQEEKIEVLIADDKPFVIMKGSKKSVNFMKDYFIAAEEVSRDLFSIYRRCKPEILNRVEPILDGVIYQSTKDENLEQDICFMPDLKWEVINYREYYKAFIEQLCLHTSILLFERYGVNNITWMYAIPKSMSDESKDIMKKMWDENMKKYLDSVSEKITHTIANTYMTESEAASRYFLYDKENIRVNATKGFLVVDIGGGSTDLALWQEEDGKVSLKWHSSINVAGRKLFTKWIEYYLENWSGLVGTDEKSLQSMLDYALAGTMPPSIKTAFIERILNSYYLKLIQIYLNGCENGAHDGWELKLRSKVTKAFSVFMFALGYQIGRLMNGAVLSPSTDGGSFIIALGGRGSKMLEWTDHGKKNENLLKFYKAGIEAAGMKFQMPLMIQRSKNPKTEVAKGLLENAESIDDGEQLQFTDKQEEIKEADFMKALDKLESTYASVYPTNSRSLEPLIFDRNQIANILSPYTNTNHESLEIFMDVLYCRYLLNAE